jgi:hypothetical protein
MNVEDRGTEEIKRNRKIWRGWRQEGGRQGNVDKAATEESPARKREGV